MHEFSITQSIVDITLETARQHGDARVVEVQLVIGTLTGIVDDSLRFYFEALTQSTPAEGARVAIEREEAIATCARCGYSAAVEPPFDALCPQCLELTLKVEGGNALTVQRILLAEDSQLVSDPDSASSPAHHPV